MANSVNEECQNDRLSNPLSTRVMALHDIVINDPDYRGPDATALRAGNTKLLNAEPGRTEWEMEIAPCHSNMTGNLHGGMACIILDNLTSMTLLTLPNPSFWDAGQVSRTITTTYLRPVPTGSKISVICEVVAAGRNTANVRGEIRVQGKACVTCIHDKVIFPNVEVDPKQKSSTKL